MGWRHIGHLGVARENRMLVGFIACRCAMNLTRLKSDDYTCRTVRKWLVDAGSIPASSTTCKSKAARLNDLAAFFLNTIRTIASKTYRYPLGPVLDFQTFDSTKVFDIIGDDNRPQGPCVSSNHEICSAQLRTPFL
jgi:hypothetical protein